MASLPKPISNLIAAFERLPGIGPKSATRLVFYLLNAPQAYMTDFAKLLMELKNNIKICKVCFSVAEGDICLICADKTRNQRIICVVERAIDVMALENVGGYKGVYHVLGGVVNPLEHVGPEDLKISELLERIRNWSGSGRTADDLEIILATNPTMEGEATALYIKNKIENLKFKNLKITRIGSGLPMGSDMEFADPGTLSRAMEGRRTL